MKKFTQYRDFSAVGKDWNSDDADARKLLATHQRIFPQVQRMSHTLPQGGVVETAVLPVYGLGEIKRTRVVIPSPEPIPEPSIQIINPRYNILSWSSSILAEYTAGEYFRFAGDTVNALEWYTKAKGYSWDTTLPGSSGMTVFSPSFVNHSVPTPATVPIGSLFVLGVYQHLTYVTPDLTDKPTNHVIDVLADIVVSSDDPHGEAEVTPVRLLCPILGAWAPETTNLFDSFCAVTTPVTCSLNGVSSNLLPNAGSHCCDYLESAGTLDPVHFGTNLVVNKSYPATGWNTDFSRSFLAGDRPIAFDFYGLGIVPPEFLEPGAQMNTDDGVYYADGDELYYDTYYEKYGYPTDYDYGVSGWPVPAGVYTVPVPAWRNIFRRDVNICQNIMTGNTYWLIGRFTGV